jgi:(1->4)-alpha-D-glucan 1-alpha-D-glucosylmutase
VTAVARPALVATYRLQLTPDFGFGDAAELVDHLHELGVSHVYTSPVFDAVPGSTHGYDVVDHHLLNDELGGEDGFRRLVAAVRERGMGLVVDVVPNHMAAHPHNEKWWDVLRFGRASRYAHWFDIDWEHGSDEVPDRLLLAVLGDHYGAVMERGELRLDVVRDGMVVRYFDHVFPLAVPSVVEVLREAYALVGDTRHDAELDDMVRLGASFAEHSEMLRRLSVLGRCWYGGDASLPCGHTSIDIGEVLAVFNRDPERLHRVLEQQHYRLANWRTGSETLDYRRFFDVTDLLGVRVEDLGVFDSTHGRLLQWVAAGDVHGLRIDHPDGLADPTGYLERLRERAPSAWIVVEKILEPGEALPTAWPVEGTTGYDASAVVDRVLVDPAGEAALDAIVREFTGEQPELDAVVVESKREVIDHLLPAEVRRIANELIAHLDRRLDRVDVTPSSAIAVLSAYLTEMPVYRTYARGAGIADAADVAVIETARDRVLERHDDLDPALVGLVAELLIGPLDDEVAVRFRTRFQQTSGPVMAKGVEDTAFYRFVRLASLNEVGSDPARFGISLDEFHETQRRAALHHPLGMVSSSTHDSKRSEDVRARISVLAEVPELWQATVATLAARADALHVGGERDRSVEYLLHQNLFGAYPVDGDRAAAYALKAAREAKRATSWLLNDEAYEAALTEAVRRWVADDEYDAAMRELVERTLEPARINSLAAKVLTLTVPGVPDLYQGSELWTDGLVDPDNRRPVDFELRRKLLADGAVTDGPLVLDDEGSAKLQVVRTALALRRRHPAAFGAEGGYEPLRATGAASDHLVAFVRGGRVAVVVPRYTAHLHADGGWRDTAVTLPPGRWTDVLAATAHEGTVTAEELFVHRPVAVLERW